MCNWKLITNSQGRNSNMRKKRFLAVVLSAAMVMGNAVMASASVSFNENDEGQVQTLTGVGTIEGGISENVFCVVVPTTPSSDSTFDYILDPQGLIAATQGARYVSGADINTHGNAQRKISINATGGYDESTLYFAQSVNGTDKVKLSPISDVYTITNKSTMEVDVSMNAKLTEKSGSKVKISTNKTFTDDKDDTTMWIDVQTQKVDRDADLANDKWSAGITVSGADPNYTAKATMDDARKFYVKRENKSTPSGYEFVIPSQNSTGLSESQNKYSTYNFRLTGSCNAAADWSGITTGAPDVTITYYLNESVKAEPSIAAAERVKTLTQDQAATVTCDFGSGSAAATKIDRIEQAGAVFNKDNYEVNGNVVTFKETYVNALLSKADFTERVHTIVFDDANQTKIDVTLKK